MGITEIILALVGAGALFALGYRNGQQSGYVDALDDANIFWANVLEKACSGEGPVTLDIKVRKSTVGGDE